jgi:hypothetical protein
VLFSERLPAAAMTCAPLGTSFNMSDMGRALFEAEDTFFFILNLCFWLFVQKNGCTFPVRQNKDSGATAQKIKGNNTAAMLSGKKNALLFGQPFGCSRFFILTLQRYVGFLGFPNFFGDFFWGGLLVF